MLSCFQLCWLCCFRGPELNSLICCGVGLVGPLRWLLSGRSTRSSGFGWKTLETPAVEDGRLRLKSFPSDHHSGQNGPYEKPLKIFINYVSAKGGNF